MINNLVIYFQDINSTRMLFWPPLKIMTCTCILKALKTNVLWPSLFRAIKLLVAFLILYYSPNSDPHPISPNNNSVWSDRSWEWMKWSAKMKCCDVRTNSLRQYHKECMKNSKEKMHVRQKELNWCYDLFFFYKMLAIFILVSLPAIFSGEKRTVLWH